MLQRLVEQARALNYPSVELHAQTQAVAFYEKFGFAKFGDEFVECGIKHFHMRMDLRARAPRPNAPAPRPRPEMSPWCRSPIATAPSPKR